MRFFIPEIENNLSESVLQFYNFLGYMKIDKEKQEKCRLLMQQIRDYNGKEFVGNGIKIMENLNFLIDCHARWRAEAVFNLSSALGKHPEKEQVLKMEIDIHDRMNIALFTIRQQLFG